MLSDQIIAENRIAKIAASAKGGMTPAFAAEEKLLKRIMEALTAMQPIRTLEFSADEKNMLPRFPVPYPEAALPYCQLQ